jgi:hypothetical protein
MRTSLNEIKAMEAYHFKTMSVEEAHRFEESLMESEELSLKLFLQKKVYAVLRLYNREKLKAEAQQIHDRLFNDPLKIEFQRSIHSIFK